MGKIWYKDKLLRITDSEEQPGKPKVYEIIVRSLTPRKGGGFTVRYEHAIKKEGWEEFFSEE
jgi:hypothetical protein